MEQKDIKALQVALNLSQNKPCNISDDREDIKHWLNLSRNGFADKLHKTYPMLDKTFLDICYLAALGLSIDEIAQYAGNIKRRSVERYMSLICQEVRYPMSGKKGLRALLTTYLLFKQNKKRVGKSQKASLYILNVLIISYILNLISS